MTFFQKLKFILKYDIDKRFYVYGDPETMPAMFISYEKAKAFKKTIPMRNPRILIEVRKDGR